MNSGSVRDTNVIGEETAALVWADVQKIRAEAPLVHNITNYVVMNATANALLAVGGSPVMAHAIEEVEEMVRHARALVLNIGTLSAAWVEAMVKAGQAARQRGIPVVLDPVGSGATEYRTATARRLLDQVRPTIVRGNASEIRSLVSAGAGPKGVDSQHSPDEILGEAHALSRQWHCAVSVSGPVDIVVAGDAVVRVANGHAMMARVTGMGCTATAITGAFVAVNPSPLQAAAHAMAVMGLAGEIAAQRAQGPGTFFPHFLDALHGLDESAIARGVRMEGRERSA
jgi:hydroxyethylthiazole kinase